MSSTSPYVSLSSHCRFLHYIGSEPNSFAVITSNTVQQRGAVRLRFHTPQLINYNNIENTAWSELRGNQEKDSQKLLWEEKELHEKEESSPYVYIVPLTSENVYPKLSVDNTDGSDGKEKNTWSSFSTLELAQECCRWDVAWNAWGANKIEQDDSLYRIYNAKRSKLEQEEPQQVKEEGLENTMTKSIDKKDITTDENTCENTNKTNISNHKVMRFVKEEVVIRTLLQVLLILKQSHHTSPVQFTVETFSSNTLTFTVKHTNQQECCNNSLMLRVSLCNVMDKEHKYRKQHLVNVKKSNNNTSNNTSSKNKFVYTNLHCVCDVAYINEQAFSVDDFSTDVTVVSREVFDYFAFSHNTKVENTSVLSEHLHEQSLNTIMMLMENNSNHNGLFSHIFDYNTQERLEEQKEEFKEVKLEQQEEKQVLEGNATGVKLEETTKVEVSESEKIMTHLQERGFVFCALFAHLCRVENIKWHLLQLKSSKQLRLVEKHKSVLRIFHLIPLQDLTISRSTTWESMLCLCKEDGSKYNVKGQAERQTYSISRSVCTLHQLQKDLLLSIRVIGCEDVLHWQQLQQQQQHDDTSTALESKPEWCSGSLTELLYTVLNMIK